MLGTDHHPPVAAFFAIHSLRGGTDLVTLQKLLGHRSLQSTTRYLTPDLVRPGVSVDVLQSLGGPMIGTIARAVGHDPALQRLRSYQRAALDDIAACGTVACGTHVQACDHCGAQRRMPNTCGNRSCPHCQGRQRAAWVQDRLEELLPCGYFPRS